jgi:sec-independent protein translocase protein TatA
MFGLGYQELLLILVIVLVLFGGSKLPDLAKSLGKSMQEFKKGVAADPDEDGKSSPPAPSATATASRTCRVLQGSAGRDLESLPALWDGRGIELDDSSAEHSVLAVDRVGPPPVGDERRELGWPQRAGRASHRSCDPLTISASGTAARPRPAVFREEPERPSSLRTLRGGREEARDDRRRHRARNLGGEPLSHILPGERTR